MLPTLGVQHDGGADSIVRLLNSRELVNVVEGAAVLSTDGTLRAEHLLDVIAHPHAQGDMASGESEPLAFPFSLDVHDGTFPLLREGREAFDRFYLEEVLRRTNGNVSSAAKLAGRNRTDFHDLLRRHELQAADFRGGRPDE